MTETANQLRSEEWQLTRCDDGLLMVHTDGDIVCYSDPNHEPGDLADEVRFHLVYAAPDMLASLDPDTLDAIADEIGGDFKHSARAASLRDIANRQRSAIAKAEGRASTTHKRAGRE